MMLRRLTVLFVLALVASACSGAETTEETPDEGLDTTTATEAEGDADIGGGETTVGGDVASAEQLRAAIVGDEGTLNPYTYVTGFPGWNLLMLQYDSLMQIDTTGVPQPWLAESVEVSDDGLTYDVTLRDGITFHDGEALTAEDVVFTADYFRENTAASRFARDLAPVESVEATGDLQVAFTLTDPAPAFDLSALADVPILPEHVWSEVTDPENADFGDTNVGSGPYRLTEYVPDQSYTLEAYDDYVLGEPTVDQVVLVQFADDTGALAAMRSGEVDVIFEPIAPEQVDLLDAQDPIDIVQGPEFSSQLLYYDASQEPWSDQAVRQAMSLAVDRTDLVETVFLGAATEGSAGWIHPDQPVFNPEVETETNLEQARQLLEEAGYTDSDDDGVREIDGEPMSYEMLTPSGDSLRLRSAELVADFLSQIGIQVEVASVEQGTWEEAVWPGFDVTQGRNYELAMWGWSAPVQADASRIVSLVHSDPAIGSLNLTGFSDPEMDALAEELSSTVDPERRAELFDEIQVLFAEELPFITLLYPNGAYAYNSEVYDNWAFIAGQGIVTKLSLLPTDVRP